MQPLSPTDAISPAFTRTRAVLFQPFRPGRSWKLAFCAYLALCGSLFIPFPVFPLLVPRPAGAGPSFSVLIWIGSVALCALMFAFYYLGSRMQFVLFDYVLTPNPLIAPLWRRHGERTWRWIALKLLVTLPISLVVLIPLYPLIKRLITLFPTPQMPPQPPDPSLIGAIFSLYAVLLPAIWFLFLIASILSDFVLPSLALEDASISESLRRLGLLCQQEPLALIGYVFMRVLLAVLGFILQYAATIIVSLPFALVLGAIAFAGWFALHTFVPKLVLIVGGAALYLTFLVCAFYIQLGTFGALIIFFRAYSLYFLGGRYPLLGNILEPLPFPGPPPPPMVQDIELQNPSS